MVETPGKRLKNLFELLTGQDAEFTSDPDVETAAKFLEEGRGLGLSQFNELLLLLGLDRIEDSFFQFLANGEVSVETQPSPIQSFAQLESGIERFRKLALLAFGNVKFGFKRLSTEPDLLWEHAELLKPRAEVEYSGRHDQIVPVQPIDGKDTYFLGYMIKDQIESRLKQDPLDQEALGDQDKREKLVGIGQANQRSYLASDHLDVYVATSMRLRHEYLMVSNLAQEIFGNKKLSQLKLRWFDPTQAYCADRIDKGLAEGLMLKRAKCTLYFAQESDTIGKDSELASTLA